MMCKKAMSEKVTCAIIAALGILVLFYFYNGAASITKESIKEITTAFFVVVITFGTFFAIGRLIYLVFEK